MSPVSHLPLLPTLIEIGVILFLFGWVLPSIRRIGPTEMGVLIKRFGQRLPGENPIAFKGEAGYQVEVKMPGWRFASWFLYSVRKEPWPSVPAGEIGLVYAQVGMLAPQGAKTAVYKEIFGNFTDVKVFVNGDGEKGIQRKVLPPGSLLPIHPVAFLVITKRRVYGLPVSPDLVDAAKHTAGKLSLAAFKSPRGDNSSLQPEDLDATIIAPRTIRTEDEFDEEEDERGNIVRKLLRKGGSDKVIDMVGVVRTLEGPPLDPNDMACRLGGFKDIEDAEKRGKPGSEVIEILLGSQNLKHNSYQNYQAFLDAGGRMGLQHDPLLYGAYNLNPYCVTVELVPMLVVEQGQVAVVKSYVGLPTVDTSGSEFKFGSIVKPGHRGIWEEPLRTGKYPVNPHIYQWEIVPTSILTLNWAKSYSRAHMLDRNLKAIHARTSDGFEFDIDLQVQIHVADTKAPLVISMVGTMYNLVNELLQSAVGNHFRDKLQAMKGVQFIITRQQIQEQAKDHITEHLVLYQVETKGVYIQDVVMPLDLIDVLKNRALAVQQKETYDQQKIAQDARIEMEKQTGMADKQKDLASSEVAVKIAENNAMALTHKGQGEASYLAQVGEAKGVEPRSVGLANATAYAAQVQALGPRNTALVNITKALAAGNQKFVPEVLVAGGGGSIEGLASTLMKSFIGGGKQPPAQPASETADPGVTTDSAPEAKEMQEASTE
jgi:hypothetical protein